MNNPKYYKLLLFFTALYMCACLCTGEGLVREEEEVTLDPTPTFTVEPQNILSDACVYFEDKEMSIVIYDIFEKSSSFTMYVNVPGGVYAPEWENTVELKFWAKMGKLESMQCVVFEGEHYMDRVYCFFPFNPDYKNTAQPFTLFMENCPEPIFSHPAVSLMVEEGSPPSESETGCGVMPTSCTSAFDAWCKCNGGAYFSCIGGVEPVCHYE